MDCCLQMNLPVYQGERRIPVSGDIDLGEHKDGRNATRRRHALKVLDRELSKGNYRMALSLVKLFNGNPGGIRGFGAAKQHEAGHFLVGYLLGVLPRGYEIPSQEVMRQDRFAAGTIDFVGFEFLIEVFMCSKYVVAGLIAEHLMFGHSEGLHSDVEQLDQVLRWLGVRMKLTPD